MLLERFWGLSLRQVHLSSALKLLRQEELQLKSQKFHFQIANLFYFFVRRALQFTNIKLQHLLSQIALALKIHQVRDV